MRGRISGFQAVFVNGRTPLKAGLEPQRSEGAAPSGEGSPPVLPAILPHPPSSAWPSPSLSQPHLTADGRHENIRSETCRGL